MNHLKQTFCVLITLITFIAVCGSCLCAQDAKTIPSQTSSDSAQLDVADINIRDPFIVTDTKNKRYLMVAKLRRDKTIGWQCYASTDLRHWQPPVPVFSPPAGFWADHDYWAPEIHLYRGKYYLFGTVRSQQSNRGTQIFVADRPIGPYHPHTDGPATPHDWMALDGTLYVENDHPWIVFCHEWVQIDDGTMNAVPLADDLSKPIGPPRQLFRASEAPWCRPIKPGKYITDGPWMYRMANGKLLLFWSSLSENGYSVGIARSQSGTIEGPWKHDPKPLFEGGGHCMSFRTLEGKPLLLLHAPNKTPNERAKFFEIHEHGDDVRLEPMAWQNAK